MTLPKFVLIGVPKAGTKSLHDYLGQHPQVAVSDVKEINFLSYPGAKDAAEKLPWLQFKVTTVDHYERLFEGVGDRVPVDLSASCWSSPASIERIRRYVPDAGLLVFLRDPVERAYSAYLHRVRKRYETRSPGDALVPGERAVDLGFYSSRLGEFIDAFGTQRVHVWLLDDMRADAAATMADVFACLGVDPSWPVDVSAVRNRSSVPRSGALHRLFLTHDRRRRIQAAIPAPVLKSVKWAWGLNQASAPRIPADVEGRLRALYADDVRRLEKMLDRDLGSWLTPVGERPTTAPVS